MGLLQNATQFHCLNCFRADPHFPQLQIPNLTILQYKAGILLVPDTGAVVSWEATAMDGALVGLGAGLGKGRDVADFSAELLSPRFETPVNPGSSAPVAAAL
jgi:hypothetical protein